MFNEKKFFGQNREKYQVNLGNVLKKYLDILDRVFENELKFRK